MGRWQTKEFTASAGIADMQTFSEKATGFMVDFLDSDFEEIEVTDDDFVDMEDMAFKDANNILNEFNDKVFREARDKAKNFLDENNIAAGDIGSIVENSIVNEMGLITSVTVIVWYQSG